MLRKKIKIIHSSPYHPQTNGVVEVTHKEIQKYIINEYFKNSENFDIEKALFDITKIHNNKKHNTTKRIPKEIKDLEDPEEIKIIQNEIIKTLSKKGKDYDIINYNKFYVFDDRFIKIRKNEIINMPKKKYKNKKGNKIPISIIGNISPNKLFIEIKNNLGIFKLGEVYEINIELLEEVTENLYKNLLSFENK